MGNVGGNHPLSYRSRLVRFSTRAIIFISSSTQNKRRVSQGREWRGSVHAKEFIVLWKSATAGRREIKKISIFLMRESREFLRETERDKFSRNVVDKFVRRY